MQLRQLARKYLLPTLPVQVVHLAASEGSLLHVHCVSQARAPESLISRVAVIAWWWWLTPFIPTLGTQRQVDLCEFEASLSYKVSPRTCSKATEKLSQKQNKTKQTKTLCWS